MSIVRCIYIGSMDKYILYKPRGKHTLANDANIKAF